jgi:hypothetical protein
MALTWLCVAAVAGCSGAFLVSSEMALFQLMEDAKADRFKEISKLVQVS